MILRSARAVALTLALALSFCTVVGQASAQSGSDGSDGPFSLAISPIGFTPTPGTYVIAFDGMFHFNENWAVGPILQVGPRSGFTLLTFTVNGRYYFQFLDGTIFDGLEPYATSGLGVGVTIPKFGSSVSEFSLNMGFGGEYPVTDHIYVGTSMLFNIQPGAAVNSFVFSWQFAQVRYRF